MGKRSRKLRESVAPSFEAVDYSAEYLSWMAELSYQTELSRRDSYERLSNCLLSCVSIISVALLTVAPLLFERYSYNDNGAAASFVLLASGYVVVMLLLGASFLLSLLSQVRLKMSVLASPMDLIDFVAGEIKRGAPFASPMEVAEGKVRAVQSHFKSLNRKNEYMRKCLKASMVLLIVAVSVCLFLVCLFRYLSFYCHLFGVDVMQDRKALVVGIDEYVSTPLYGCVADANAVAEVLEKNGDGSPNFSIHLEQNVESPYVLKQMIEDCFSGEPEIALLYFAGHGGRCDATKSGFILSGRGDPEGRFSLDEILAIANSSKAKNRVILLDSCNSGCMGAPGVLGGTSSMLVEGLTILSACCSNECAEELNGRGTFTSLLVDALNGGAADVMGHVTPGGVYAYIDKALGPWDQRPVFRTNVNSFISLRKVVSQVPDSVLRQLPSLFDAPGAQLSLDPSFEPTNSPDWEEHQIVEPYATKDNTEKFKILQQLEGIGLVRPVGAEHMYFAAMKSRSCELTALGKQYWRLADTGKI